MYLTILLTLTHCSTLILGRSLQGRNFVLIRGKWWRLPS